MGRDDGWRGTVDHRRHDIGYLILLGFIQVVGDIHTLHVDGLIGGVVQLHPVVVLEVFVDVDAVGGAHLVDAYRHEMFVGEFFLAQGLEHGHKRYLRITWQADDRVGGHDLLFDIADRGLQRGGPVEVAGGVARVVHLYGHHILAFMEQRGRQLKSAFHWCAAGVGLREGVKADSTLTHVDTSGLLSVDIDDTAVVHLIAQDKEVAGYGCLVQVHALPEVSGGIFLLTVAAIADSSGDAAHGIA